MTAATDSRPIDFHVHIQPWEMMHPQALRTIREGRADAARIDDIRRDPAELVKLLDEEGIAQVALINYVAPEIMGFGPDVNDWVARYRDGAPDRILAFGGIHPPATRDVASEMDRLIEDLRLDGLKIHPPHQALPADAYRTGVCPSLALVYARAEEAGLPVMFHTGTSIFPGARSRLGDPLVLDDVAIDFPNLTIILAHGGRPFWMDRAFFLLRRHPNVYMDISGIPPASLLRYFPRLQEVADKVLFGTDWPSPGVRSIRANIDGFLELPLPDEARARVLHGTARKILGERRRAT